MPRLNRKGIITLITSLAALMVITTIENLVMSTGKKIKE
jgi:hypothetical protein